MTSRKNNFDQLTFVQLTLFVLDLFLNPGFSIRLYLYLSSFDLFLSISHSFFLFLTPSLSISLACFSSCLFIRRSLFVYLLTSHLCLYHLPQSLFPFCNKSPSFYFFLFPSLSEWGGCGHWGETNEGGGDIQAKVFSSKSSFAFSFVFSSNGFSSLIFRTRFAKKYHR